MSGASKKRRRRGLVLIRFAAMAGKEVNHILRDPQVLLFALGMPVVLLLLFGYAVTFDIDHIPLVVVDQEQSASSRELIAAFEGGDLFEVVAVRETPEEVEPLLQRGVAKVGLIIPEGFDRELLRGDSPQAQLLLDGTDNNSAGMALGYANALSQAATKKAAERAGTPLELPLEARARTLYNPGLRSTVVLVPGLMVILLVMVAVMLTALTVAREYERGSMEQLFATPIGRLEVILGKLAPYFILGMVDVLLVVTVGVLLFDVPIAGELAVLTGVSALFMLAMLMQGLFISVATRNQMVASQLAVISTLLPSLLLSGFIFPVESMPSPLQVVASIFPARYFVHAVRVVMLKGGGFESIGVDCLAIGLFFLAMLAVSIKRFRRSVA